MTTEFRDMLDRFVLIYLDDILVYSRTLDEHIVHLRAVLDRLRTAKYKANRAKCEFAQQELEYLGHFVMPQGISPLADKIKAIQDWPEPTNTTEVRSFMGLAGDCNTRFMSAFWTSPMKEFGTEMKPSSARHPQTDGQTEWAHQTAQVMLRTLIRTDQKDWVDRLPDIEFAYNTLVHPAIGVTPFELHHRGRKGHIFADLPFPRTADIVAACSPASVRKYRELLAKARANMQKAQVRMQQQANRRRVPCPIRVGDLVWVSTEEFALEQDVSRKLLPKWFGPWPVTSAVGDEPDGPSFVIEIPSHLTVHPVFHASKLATYTPAKSDDVPGRRSHDPPSMDGHQDVDRVITHRKHDNKPITITSPLTDLTRLDTPWDWTDECEPTFKRLKHALTLHEVLMVPDPQRPFVASQYGIGAVMAQQEGKKLRLVEYMSNRVPSKKLAKSTYERELYALYKALVHWRHYVLRRFFYLRYDHQTLNWIKTQPILSDALKRWIEVIDQYDFKLDYVKGEYNKVADALSCRADYLGAPISEFGLPEDVTRSLGEAYKEDPITMYIINKLQAKDKATTDEFIMVDGLLFLERAGFMSEMWKKATKQMGSELQMTSGNHPEANGQAEQMNRVVQHLLKHYIKPNQDDRDEKLPLIASLYSSRSRKGVEAAPKGISALC
ncbi:hypothetical protein CBR_g8472 [Chara braunii]|uniref:Integrase catalytic domain-containing protein n=1 Tax=Chara braunii TaxID=69332 RepID=A0A388KM94_CHABU|nr:hypothetical protein CBR_g8472 [Chara braunii]|eukprot:GBG71170.1 hypothetical protein CBR_g8472 [Chara braunii]